MEKVCKLQIVFTEALHVFFMLVPGTFVRHVKIKSTVRLTRSNVTARCRRVKYLSH